VWINDTHIFSEGRKVEYDEARLRELLAGDPVEIRVDLGVGEGSATAYGCDLTHGYIEENAAYYSS
jgi:glutamate N-acetyltransferase/amino-acid N-acetyltransferase